MKYLLSFILFLFSFFSLNAQTTLYFEDFETAANDNKGQNGNTYDVSGVTNWVLDVTNTTFSSGDWFKQTGGVFESYNTDASSGSPVWWGSTVVSIAGYSNVTVSCDLSRNSSNSGSGVQAYYRIDGGGVVSMGSIVGGGASPNSLSVAGLTGSTIQVLIKHWGTSSTPKYRHDNVKIEGTAPACTPPTTQATGINFSNVAETSIDVAWTNGNGDNTLVVVKESGVAIADPVGTVAYTANSVYASGDDLGGGNYVVYNGAGSSVSITGLSAATTYDVAIYTYNSADDCYNVDELSASQATDCTPPTSQASALSFSNITKTSLDLSWTNGNGTAVLVVASLASATQADPSIGVTYTANNSFGDGDEIGSGNYVVYNGTGTAVSVGGLTSATDYVFTVYTFFSASNCYNLTELLGAETTLAGTNYTGLGNVGFNIDVYNGDTITGCTGWFRDSGGSGGNYGNNEDYTITFCSDGVNPMAFDFDNDQGDFAGLSNGDTLYMYDEFGELIMKIDPSDDGYSFYYFELRTISTCVTFRFVSNGSGVNGGWNTKVECVAAPADCNGNTPAADIALQAPYICNFDGYCGSTSTYYKEDLPGNLIQGDADADFGGTIQNNSWLRFVAGATSVSLEFTVSGCGTDGIQVAVLGVSGTDWTRYSSSALSDGGHTGTFDLAATGLTVGETYFIMADGNSGADCDYTINVDGSDGVITVDATADLTTVCAGDPVSLSVTGIPGATYTWNSLDGVVVDVDGETQTFNPTVETTYVVEVTGGGICEAQTDTVVVAMCIPTPVELLGFSVACKVGFVELNWQTATEINNDYFLIEKSLDAVNFSAIGTVAGFGNSNNVNSYVFQDFESNSGVVYYRFKQVDFNGDFTYSNIVAANNCAETTFDVGSVFFNDLSNELVINYNSPKTEKVQVVVYDALGKLVVNSDLSFYQNQNQKRIQFNTSLSGSIYFVNIITEAVVESHKVVVSH